MTFLIVLGVILCALVVVFGLWLLWRNRNGDIPLEKALFKAQGTSIEGSVGFVITVAAIVVAAWLISRYEPAVEAQNKQLTAENAEVKKDRDDTKKQKGDLEEQLRAEKANSDTLSNKVRALTTENTDLQGKLFFAQGELSKANANLTKTQGLLDTETARAKDLAAKNDNLAKQLADEQSQRKEAQQQVLAAWETVDRMGLSQAQQDEFDKIKKGVDDLNADLTTIRIAPAYWPRLEGKRAVATYEIYQKTFEADQMRPRGAGLFDFNSERSEIKGDYNGRLSEALRNNIAGMICDAARRAMVQNISLPDAVRSMPPIRDYDLDRQLLATLSEVQYARMRLQLMAGMALVLVRGYADGEQGPWRRDLDPSLATVRLHENVNPNAQPIEYALNFRAGLTNVTMGQKGGNGLTYGNDDLPNLRAEEVSGILSALIGSCPESSPNTSAGTIPVEILEGRVYPQHSEIDRKARVHLLVFLKEQ